MATFVQVTGTFTTPQGDPAEGVRVTMKLDRTVQDGETNQTFAPSRVRSVSGADGVLPPLTVLATEDGSLVPADARYRLELEWPSGARQTKRVTVPAANLSVFELLNRDPGEPLPASTGAVQDHVESASPHLLGDLGDVDLAGAAAGQALLFNGASWVPDEAGTTIPTGDTAPEGPEGDDLWIDTAADPIPVTTELGGLADVDASGQASGDVLGFNGSVWGPVPGTFGLRQVLTFTADGSFTKASYPWLRAVRAKVQAGGGGGGGSAGGSGEACAGGGGGGGYAESLVDVDALGASETVTVGAGGAGGAAGNNGGGAGGASSFGAHVSAGPGQGGSGSESATGNASTGGGAPGGGSVGQVKQWGARGGAGIVADGSNLATRNNHGGQPGSGAPGRIVHGASGGAQIEGEPGPNPGGGGSGARSRVSDRAGGDGAPGIVIVELYG